MLKPSKKNDPVLATAGQEPEKSILRYLLKNVRRHPLQTLDEESHRIDFQAIVAYIILLWSMGGLTAIICVIRWSNWFGLTTSLAGLGIYALVIRNYALRDIDALQRY